MSGVHAIVETVRRPEVWALTFFIAASEASSFVTPTSTMPYLLGLEPWIVVPLAVYALLFLFSSRIDPMLEHSSTTLAAFAVGFLGLCLRLAATDNGIANALYLVGEAGLSTGIILLGYIVVKKLVKLPLVWTIRSLVVSSFIGAFIVPLYYANDFWSTAIPLGACAACLLLSKKRDSEERASKQLLATSSKKSTYETLAGFLLITICFGFLQTFLYQENESTVGTVVTITKLAAVGIFAIAIARMQDTGYSLLAKTIITISVAALAVLLSSGRASLVSMSLMATGYSLLEITYLLIMVNIAALSSSTATRVFSVFYFVDTLGYLIGSQTSNFVTFNPSASNVVTTILVIALSTAAIWVFDEKHVNALLWSGKADEQASHKGNEDEGFLDFESRLLLLAEERGLSPREVEILRLFASGRSASFIAESMFISSNTVRTHIKHIYAKCDIHSRQELITRIEESGMRNPSEP